MAATHRRSKLVNAPPPTSPETVDASVELGCSEWQLNATVTVPKGLIRRIELLPVIQSLADSVINATVRATEADGKRISCKAGCGACCRQLVPISGVEAHRLRDVIDELPEPRRSEIRRRFARAQSQLEQSGLLETLHRHAQLRQDEAEELGRRYFLQQIVCPFLENESCSIYANRPVTCREYLVTSPAENCSRPATETLNRVRIPLKLMPTLADFDRTSQSAPSLQWIPLILAPKWADAHPDETSARPGPELLHEMLNQLQEISSSRREPGKGQPTP
jgi:Fe-S-cluster containining protein